MWTMTRFWLRGISVLAITFAALTLAGVAGGTHLPRPRWDQIAFVTDEAGGWHVHASDIPHRMTISLLDDRIIHPGRLTWSADGSQLLLEGTSTGLYGIYLLDWHTRQFQRLTGEQMHSRSPSWSVDGNSFVFRQISTQESGIYVMSLRDGTQRRLIRDGNAPVWSPDGSLIAFIRETGVGAMIHIMNADGSSERAFDQPRVKFPSTITWSPDSQRIAYIGLNKDLHIVTIATGEDTDTGIEMYRSPVWSADASTIVLFNQRGQRGTFYALDIASGEQHVISVYSGGGTVTSFDWRPSRCC